MNDILKYTVIGAKVFVALILIYVCILGLCSSEIPVKKVLDAAMITVAAVDLFLGIAQLCGCFLVRWASLTVKACEWIILVYLIYKLWFENLIFS